MTDPRFFLRSEMNEPVTTTLGNGIAAVFSTRCPSKSTDNEDAAAIVSLDEARHVLVIADGMGGLPGGALAASLAVQAMHESVETAKLNDTTLRDAILNGFETANQAVASIGTGAATTLTVVGIEHDTVRPYHVGDSLILLMGQRGKIKLQTASHSPVGYAVEAGLLEEREAMHHADRHIVSNMVGSAEMRIEIGPMLTMNLRDTLIIASDGLFDNLHTSEIVEHARKGSLPKAAAALATISRARMTTTSDGQPSKPDDLTFIAYRRAPVTASRSSKRT
jgi:serine/threonine protein phosphatase PrpC